MFLCLLLNMSTLLYVKAGVRVGECVRGRVGKHASERVGVCVCVLSLFCCVKEEMEREQRMRS